MESGDAHVVARAALTVPGIGDHQGRKGINFSRSWRPVSEPKRSQGLVRVGQAEPLATSISAEAAKRLGVGPPGKPHWGTAWQKPHGVDLATWNATVELVAEEFEATDD